MALARQILLERALPGLAQRAGVLKTDELRRAGYARSVVDAAQREADEIIAEAHARAETVVAERQREIDRLRDELLHDAEETFWRDAAAHQRALDARVREFSTALEDNALAVVRQAITVLAGEMPPEERVRACVRALLAETGSPPESTLFVNEQDMAALEGMQDKLAWPIKADAQVAPGNARLSGKRGDWHSSFECRLERLLAVFDISCSTSEQGDEST
jgi:vacuolar-type H+-ATPase subunit E/Vma4